MKKIILILVAMTAFAAMAFADNSTPIQVVQMPTAAQNFIQKHFGDVQVSHAKQENGLSKSYEVVFVNGNKLEFDARGEWTEVDCKHGVVPEGIVPRQLKHYVDKNHPGQKIVAISREARGYEIDLNNGLELKFNRNYRLVDMDD